MKNFLEGVLEWKTWAALMFSGAVVIYIVIAALMGATEIPILEIVSLLIVSTAGTFIQYVAFGPRIIKRMRYTVRMIVFAVPFLALLSGVAYFFHWFPSEHGLAWLSFLAGFLLAFAGATISFEIYFKVTGKKYDGLLGQYRKRLEEEGKGGNPHG